MKAARIHRFGSPEEIVLEEIPRPVPAAGEVLVRVAAAGVGPWDALIRRGESKVSPPPPLTLGSDLSGVVEAVGPDVTKFQVGEEVYGTTNEQFVGAYAEYANASANMVATKPRRLTHVEAASVPVVAVTAWQMLFDYAHVVSGQRVLILGAGGNVGAYAVQLAVNAGLHVIATTGSKHAEFVRSLGAETVLDYHAERFEDSAQSVDVVLDMVGGAARDRSLLIVKPGGILVSVVSTGTMPERADVRSVFFYVALTTERLNIISELLDSGKISPNVGSVLPLQEARTAHELLAGAPHKRGKIVLQIAP